MVVSDLDGTLVDSDCPGYVLSKDLIEAVRLFREAGKLFTIATGRPESTSINVAKELELDIPYIAYNGAMILDSEGKRIYSAEFELNQWRGFLHNVRQIGATVLLYMNGGVYYLDYTERVKIYEHKERTKCIQAEDGVLDKNLKVNKILLIGNVQELKKYWDNVVGSLKSKCRYTISEHNYMEIIRQDVSKGAALRYLKKYLKLKDNEVVGIGNHMNDLELLEESHIGIAVSNAEEELKKAANYVTEGSFHEGVIEVIKKYIQR